MKIIYIKLLHIIVYQIQIIQYSLLIRTKNDWFVLVICFSFISKRKIFLKIKQELFHIFVDFGRTFIEQALMMSSALLKSSIQVKILE